MAFYFSTSGNTLAHLRIELWLTRLILGLRLPEKRILFAAERIHLLAMLHVVEHRSIDLPQRERSKADQDPFWRIPLPPERDNTVEGDAALTNVPAAVPLAHIFDYPHALFSVPCVCELK